MNAPLYVIPPGPMQLPEPPLSLTELTDLFRQSVDLQREQVALLKQQAAAQDQLSRWKAFLARWSGDFPEVGGGCKQVLPVIERAYLALIRDMIGKLKECGEDLEDEFVLGEFLDKYGIRLSQLGNILSQIGPIADAAPAEAPPAA